MRLLEPIGIAAAGVLACASLSALTDIDGAQSVDQQFWSGIQQSIDANLGRPYVWGSTGLKTYDCSGFIWRIMSDNGILMNRTTARKLYVALPETDETGRFAFGTLVFFDDLKHVGIVRDSTSFYHAQSSKGTTLSTFKPYWATKVAGFRAFPGAP